MRRVLQWRHLPNASANTVGGRAEQCVGTRQVAVRSVVDEPPRVSDTSQSGGRREAGQPAAQTVDVEQNARATGTARVHITQASRHRHQQKQM